MKRSQVLQLNRCQNFKVGPGSLMLISIFVFDTFKNEYESVKETNVLRTFLGTNLEVLGSS